ncbi:MAG: hypothetical protein DPW09_34960 [Anaerolineae bacterium]|nr:hypothetical protein [Anaerolineae bacterium]
MTIKAQTITPRREGLGILIVNLGLAANTLLALLKTSIGILGHSPALLADGINSTSDVAYYIVVMFFMRLASKPADAEHRFLCGWPVNPPMLNTPMGIGNWKALPPSWWVLL